MDPLKITRSGLITKEATYHIGKPGKTRSIPIILGLSEWSGCGETTITLMEIDWQICKSAAVN